MAEETLDVEKLQKALWTTVGYLMALEAAISAVAESSPPTSKEKTKALFEAFSSYAEKETDSPLFKASEDSRSAYLSCFDRLKKRISKESKEPDNA